MRFSWGKIWFGRFAPCKRFDILQLCSSRIMYRKMGDQWQTHQVRAPTGETHEPIQKHNAGNKSTHKP